MRQPILFDCDGVLLDFCGHLADLTGIEAVRAPSSYEFRDHLDGGELALVLETMRDDAFWRSMPKMPGAPERLPRDTIIVTKPYRACRTWLDARLACLARNFKLRPDRVITATRKHLVVGRCLIDDDPGNVRKYRDAWGPNAGFVFDAPYNKELGNQNRVTWKDGKLVPVW